MVAGAVSIFTLGMVALLVQHGHTRRTSQVLGALPATTRAVVRVDTAALARTAAAKTLVDAFVAEDRLTEVESVCGLDPLESLAEATLWVRGPDDQPFQSVGLMLRGRTADAEALARCHRLLVEGRGGTTVRLEGMGGPLLASEDRRSAVAALDERTVITGSVHTVAEALALRRAGSPSLLERARVASLWPRVSAGSSVAAILDPPSHWRSALERMTTLGAEASALGGVETIGLSVKTGSAHSVEIYVVVADATTAAENASVIRRWAGSPPESLEARWADALRTMQVRVDERVIAIALDVTSLSRPH